MIVVAIVGYFTLFGAGINIEGYHPIIPDIHTRYTEDFTKANFALVKPRMHKYEVIRLLGKPFDNISDNYWYYSSDNGLSAWIGTYVHFDNKGQVTHTDRIVLYD